MTQVARNILGYLHDRPHARDSREAIATWWLMRQEVEQAVHRVSRALELLVIRGLVVERRRPGADPTYEMNRKRLDAVERFLRESEP